MIPGYTKTAFMKLASGQYTIGPGDTFYAIERRHNLKPGTLERLNSGVDPKKLMPGSVINFPAGVKPIQAQPTATKSKGGYVVPQLYHYPTHYTVGPALAYAETGSEPNPWIRTKVRPKKYWDDKKKRWIQLESTAFGPDQVTKGLLTGALRDYPEFDKKWRPFVTEVMLPMYALHFKNSDAKAEGYDPIYGYGGTSGWDSKYNDQYKEMVADLRRITSAEALAEWNKLPEAERTINRLMDLNIYKWRRRTRDQDPSYYRKVYDHMAKNSPHLFDKAYKPSQIVPLQIPEDKRTPYVWTEDNRPGITKDPIGWKLYQKLYNREQEKKHREAEQAKWEARAKARNKITQDIRDNQINAVSPIANK